MSSLWFETRETVADGFDWLLEMGGAWIGYVVWAGIMLALWFVLG